MGGKGGSADQSGEIMAQASAQEAQLAYSLGTQQLQWAKDVWNADQPLVNQSEQSQINLANQETISAKAANDFAAQQEAQYNQLYAPLEATYVNQAENWASPANTALVQGQAETAVGEQSNAALNTSQEQLRSYGINPGAARYGGLTIGTNAMMGASEAAAGTKAAQDLQLQQLGLESQAINTGRGLVNSSTGLTNAGTGASSSGSGSASGAANTANQNLATGSSAMNAPVGYINAGSNAMNTYVNAVNGYNQANLGFSQLNASSASGLGSAAGGILGLLAKGGAVTKFADGGPTQAIPTPHGATPGGSVPTSASPSGGSAVDDVDAKLTAGEFVIPKDVAQWRGHEHFVKQIDKAREEQHVLSQRKDIGGEKVSAIPHPNPPFQSQPFNAHAHNAANTMDAMRQAMMPPPSMHPSHVMAQMGRPQSAIPMRRVA